jgi:hypothetical protein
MTTVNNRTLSGIISLSDGAGSIIENGKVSTNIVDSGHLTTDTSEIGDLEIDRLWLQEHLQVDGLFITPTWLSYLYGLTSNIQTQISSISTTLLAGANTWTGAQTFSGNAVNLIFEKTSSLVPTQNSNTIGAIYGRSANSKALTFLNSSDNVVSNVIAFAWDKLGAGGGSVTTIASMTNSGGFTTAGNISSPNITTMTTDIINLGTDKQNVINTGNRLDASLVGSGVVSNAEFNFLNGVTSAIQTQINALSSSAAYLSIANTWSAVQTWAVGTRIDILGSTATSTWPTRASNGAGSIFCRGTTTYNMALSFINTNSNAVSGDRAFQFTKQTGVSSGVDLLRINNDGSTVITGNISSPNITTMTNNIINLQTDKQNVINTSNRLDATLIGTGVVDNTEFNFLDGVTSSIQTQLNAIVAAAISLSGTNIWTSLNTFNLGIKIIRDGKVTIEGSTLPQTAPTVGNNAAIFTRGGATYGNTMSLMNAFSDTAADTIAFDWSKRTTVTTDLARIYNDGHMWVKDSMQMRIPIYDIALVTVDTIYNYNNLPGVIIIGLNCDVNLPATAPEGMTVTFIRKSGNVNINSSAGVGNKIWYSGAYNYRYVFNSGPTFCQLIFDSAGSWVLMI